MAEVVRERLKLRGVGRGSAEVGGGRQRSREREQGKLSLMASFVLLKGERTKLTVSRRAKGQ